MPDPARSPILISGASGLLGRALGAALRERGDAVIPLVRRPAQEGERQWDPARGLVDRPAPPACRVVYLAGENVGEGRWSEGRRAELRASRVEATAALARDLAAAEQPPEVFVAASAVGFYGDRGDEWLDEGSEPGSGFLADTCQEWEAAAAPLRDAGTRVVHARIGIVLAAEGGALAEMLPLFRWGLGGRLGSGRQWWSWIAHADVVAALVHALDDDELAGPVNLVAPEPVRQAEFTRILARRLHRPAILPAPAFGLRLALGRQKADELLLASARVRPGRLTERGFSFRSPTLDEALATALAGT